MHACYNSVWLFGVDCSVCCGIDKTQGYDHNQLEKLTNLLHHIGLLLDAKVSKKNLDSCLDGLLTIFKGHLVAAACIELGISSPDEALVISDPVTKEEQSVRVKVEEVAQVVVDKWKIVSESVVRQHLQERDDGV